VSDVGSWPSVKALFQAALERPASEREGFIHSAARGDPDLIADVDSLLRSDAVADDFLEAPIPVLAAVSSTEPTVSRTGSYRIVRRLGEGGMGAVYLAVRDDGAFRKQVAIKLIGTFAATELAIERFRHERQILADLDHPNIARLLDGGTTTAGLPYVVMEYVDGVPIDRFVAERSLSISERLRLFIDVCGAVQFAHQRFVIHRDLKPGNIFVTTDGVPKLLDFGIAKLVGADGARANVTVTALRMLTPECASPEQIRGEHITTASDVYALGVLLYRLLTDRGPYAVAEPTPHVVARAICEEDPRRPSDVVRTAAIARRLRGDLDTIVLKALQKDPRRRYASVEQLSQDAHRHLEHLPVFARPDSRRYRAAKFIARHRAGVAAAALVAISLVAGLGAATWEAHAARVQRSRAEARFNDVRQLTTSFLFEFHDAIAHLPGATAARQLVVAKALEYSDHLARDADAEGNVELQRDLAAAYLKLGDVQGQFAETSLGQSANAMASYRRALDFAMKIPADRRILGDDKQVALAHFRLGDASRVTGDLGAALKEYDSSLAAYQHIATRTNKSDDRLKVEEVQDRRAGVLLDAGRVGEAIAQYETLVAEYGDALAATQDDHQLGHNLAVVHWGLGAAYHRMADWPAARRSLEAALIRFDALARRYPDDVRERRGVSAAASDLSIELRRLGDVAGAIAMLQRALTADETLLTTDPHNAQLRRDHAITLANLAESLADAGRSADAYRNFESAEHDLGELAASDPANARAARAAAASRLTFGRFLLRLGRNAEAINWLRRAEQDHAVLVANDRANADVSVDLAVVRLLLGKAYRAHAGAGSANSDSVRTGCQWYESSVRLFAQLRLEHKLANEDQADAKEAEDGSRACHAATSRH